MKVKPFEYCFLSNPLFSSSEDYFKYIIQDFCLKEILNIKLEWIHLTKRDKRLRLRPFIGIGKHFETYTTNSISEQFVLDFFRDEPALRTYQIRNKLKRILLNDIEKFKKEYVLKEIKANDLGLNNFILTSKGKQAKKEIKPLLNFINKHIVLLRKRIKQI